MFRWQEWSSGVVVETFPPLDYYTLRNTCLWICLVDQTMRTGWIGQG